MTDNEQLAADNARLDRIAEMKGISASDALELVIAEMMGRGASTSRPSAALRRWSSARSWRSIPGEEANMTENESREFGAWMAALIRRRLEMN